MTYYYWTQDEDARLIDMLKANMSCRHMEVFLPGRSRGSIATRIHKLGLRDKVALTPEPTTTSMTEIDDYKCSRSSNIKGIILKNMNGVSVSLPYVGGTEGSVSRMWK